jgi:hypothetical protein
MLSIHQVQYTDDPVGASLFEGQMVDCAGGIVVHKYPGSQPRLVLQDPNPPGDPRYADGWAGIQVKDWTVSHDLFEAAGVGDWVTLTGVLVEEFRGTTFLQYRPDLGSGFEVTGSGHPLPAPKPVAPEQIPAPLEGPPGEWHVADHRAEMYESMLLEVADAAVTEVGLGKNRDNYNLRSGQQDVWASDYTNVDRWGLYHPLVSVGAGFAAVRGVLEQYTKIADGFDYYQLLTRGTSDFVVPAPAAIMVLLASAPLLVRRGGRSRR